MIIYINLCTKPFPIYYFAIFNVATYKLQAMQESSHLWLKIASKYAGEAITKSPNKAAKRTSSDDKTPPNKRQKGSANSSGGVSTPMGSNQAAVAGDSGTQESPENELMREQRRLIKVGIRSLTG